jgi:methylmalonyl-CoA/ethylmalonyl-CoA epimerase
MTAEIDVVQLHHIAYVTKDIERKADELRRILGIQRVAEPVVDLAQGVRILFLNLGGTQLELLEPLGPESPIFKRAQKTPGLFHLCFEVDDVEKTLQSVLATDEATLVKEPLPAPAIENRHVAFVVSAGNDLFEFVEREAKGDDRGTTANENAI